MWFAWIIHTAECAIEFSEAQQPLWWTICSGKRTSSVLRKKRRSNLFSGDSKRIGNKNGTFPSHSFTTIHIFFKWPRHDFGYFSSTESHLSGGVKASAQPVTVTSASCCLTMRLDCRLSPRPPHRWYTKCTVTDCFFSNIFWKCDFF